MFRNPLRNPLRNPFRNQFRNPQSPIRNVVGVLMAGVVAAHTDLPVIGVPLRSRLSVLDGLDALLSIVQMPPGVPVATVGVDNAKNAAVLAARILDA